jgi:DNA-directed RNA polymerase subunit RPC12/RpoP
VAAPASEPKTGAEESFKCKTCGKIVPNEDGGDDDMPDSCSDCGWRNDIESRISALESRTLTVEEIVAVRALIRAHAR